MGLISTFIRVFFPKDYKENKGKYFVMSFIGDKMIEDGLPDEYTDPKKAINDARRVAYKNWKGDKYTAFVVRSANFKKVAFGTYDKDGYYESIRLKGFTSEDPAEQEENEQE